MKKINLYIIILISAISVMSFTPIKDKKVFSQKSTVSVKNYGKALNFFVISDWGWSGYKDQQIVADQMGIQAEQTDPQFIVSCGDNFQVAGVASIQDPLWMSSFENVYKNNSLQVEWYPVLGNHDYKGNTRAQIDYSKISRRWRMEDHYYTFVKKINDTISARFIFLDTPPLVDEYHTKTGYPDIAAQDTAKQMSWLNDVLANSKEQWKVVFGHHPVYSASKKHGNTIEMIQKVKPLLEKYHAQFYFCGHDHDFQHLREKGKSVEYVVTGTGGEPRPSSKNELSLFSNSTAGFSEVTFHADSIRVIFMGANGVPQYSIERSYR